VNFKYTLILAGVLIVLAGYIAFLQTRKPEREEPPPEVWSVEENDIRRIELRLPREGKKEAFILGDDDKWYFDDESRTPVDIKRWGGIVLLVSSPQSKRMIADKVENLADFGLTDPRLIISLGVRNREHDLDVMIGDPTPHKDFYYVKLRNGDPLYLVNNTFVEVFTRLVNEPPVPPLIQERKKAQG